MSRDAPPLQPRVRRHSRGVGAKGINSLAGDILRDIAQLFRVQLQLLRAELHEKLAFAARSLCLIAVGALLLVATLVLLLQAAVAELVAFGLSLGAASLSVAGITFMLGGGLLWYGFSRMTVRYMAPARSFDQLQKNIKMANMG
jgi:putative superfamily III holin-X